MKLLARLRLAGPIPSETIRTTFLRLGVSMLVRRVTAIMIINVPRRVRKKGRTLRREVKRRNQWACSCEEEREEYSSSESSSGREGRRGDEEEGILTSTTKGNIDVDTISVRIPSKLGFGSETGFTLQFTKTKFVIDERIPHPFHNLVPNHLKILNIVSATPVQRFSLQSFSVMGTTLNDPNHWSVKYVLFCDQMNYLVYLKRSKYYFIFALPVTNVLGQKLPIERGRWVSSGLVWLSRTSCPPPNKD